MRTTGSDLPIRRIGNFLVVQLPQEIDTSNSTDVREQLLGLLNSDGPASLIIDLTSTEFCDSSAIRALIRARARANGSCRRLYAAVPPAGMVRRVFDLTAVSRLIPVHDDVGSAIAAAVDAELENTGSADQPADQRS